MADPKRLEILADKDEIREVLHRYCHGIDRRDAQIVASIFHPDAQLEYGAFSGNRDAFVAFTSDFLGRVGPTHHNVTNILITVDGDKASSLSYCIAVHGDVEVDGSMVDLVAYVRYADIFERRDGVWRISRREVIYDWNQNIPRTANWTTPVAAMMTRGAFDSSDPSYRIPAARIV